MLEKISRFKADFIILLSFCHIVKYLDAMLKNKNLYLISSEWNDQVKIFFIDANPSFID